MLRLRFCLPNKTARLEHCFLETNHEKMLSVVLRRSIPKFVAQTPKTFAVRAFSADKFSIPQDAQQQYGRRKEELDAEAAGEVGFNREPIITTDDAGTKENPILVRIVLYFLFSNKTYN